MVSKIMASSRPKLFIFDVDGTLLTSTYSILSTTQHVLDKIQSVGHFVMLAGARPPKSARPITLQTRMMTAASLKLSPISTTFKGDL